VKDSNWDLDLRAGLEGESLVADLLSLDTIEVKTDRKWKTTGNLYIETQCYYVATQEWKDSGLSVTKADYWGFVMEKSVLMVQTDTLKKAVALWGKPISCDMEPNPSRGYLITPNEILEYTRYN
jgi:hypothetical protein